jgi:hypothetical protein
VGPAPLAGRSLRSQLRAGGPQEAPPATIFASCLVDRMTPEAGLALDASCARPGTAWSIPARSGAAA